jgi:hypothetical protein
MTDTTSGAPPPHVAQAAQVVDQWLRQQPAARVSDAEFAKMSPAERIAYTRRFDQTQFSKDARTR